MSQSPGKSPHTTTSDASASEAAISVVSAYGLFRVLLVLLVAWTFFAGFSLLTAGFGWLSLGGQDKAAERIIGAQMLMLVPIYLLLMWRRTAYRFFVWVPYAAQIAIVVPALWELVLGDHEIGEGVLLYVVSLIFLVLLVYISLSSKQMTGEFIPDGDEEDFEDEDDEEEELEVDEEDDEADTGSEDAAPQRPRRYRRTT